MRMVIRASVSACFLLFFITSMFIVEKVMRPSIPVFSQKERIQLCGPRNTNSGSGFFVVFPCSY